MWGVGPSPGRKWGPSYTGAGSDVGVGRRGVSTSPEVVDDLYQGRRRDHVCAFPGPAPGVDLNARVRRRATISVRSRSRAESCS